MAGQGSRARYVIELPDTTGRGVEVVFMLRRDTVEAWYQDRCQAVMDRESFRYWLTHRSGPYVIDDVMWVVSETGEVALVLRYSGWWVVPPRILTGLSDRV